MGAEEEREPHACMLAPPADEPIDELRPVLRFAPSTSRRLQAGTGQLSIEKLA
jgi:hypothetical protein